MLDPARTLEALIRARIAIRESREYLAGDIGPGGGGLPGGAVDTAVQGFHAVPRFNPNHDPASGEFTSGGGGGAGHGKMAGKHAAKRARRAKRREALRKELKARAKEIRKDHTSQWKALGRDEAKERKSLRREQGKERARAIRDARKSIAGARTKGERNEYRQVAKHELEVMKEDHAEARKGLREDHEGNRASIRGEHKEEWASFRDDIKQGIEDAGFKAKKRSLSGVPRVWEAEADRVIPDTDVTRRLSPYRLHKAGNAESILRACLRQLGWTARYRRGELTGRQHLALLEAVRQYGRAWLRHEAEQFANHYLARAAVHEIHSLFPGADGLMVPGRSGLADDQDRAARKINWEPGPGGFLNEVERPGFTAHVGRFFRRAKAFIGEVITAGVMSLLGPAPLTKDDLDAAERETQKQTQFFDRFHAEIAHSPPAPPTVQDPTKPLVILVVPPPMTPGQFVARVEKYGDSTHQAAQRVNHGRAVANPRFRVERLVMGMPKTEHCEECPVDAALGWVPIGTLRPIGDRECGGNCLCHLEFADSPGGQPHIQGNKGPIPAPAEAPVALPDDDEIHMIAEPPGLSLLVPIAGPAK